MSGFAAGIVGDSPAQQLAHEGAVGEKPAKSGRTQRRSPEAPAMTGQSGEDGGPFLLYFSAFFIVVAAILGTGILVRVTALQECEPWRFSAPLPHESQGLPVTLANSGMAPFAVTFAVCLVMQLSVVWLTVDLLQWTRVRLEALMAASAPAVTDAAAPASAEYSQLQDGDGKQAEPTEQPQGDTHLTTAPDLHAMGKMFLGKSSRLAFDAAVVLHFISVLVGYALAGSLAYAQLFGILGHYTLVIPIYIAVYFLIIIFGGTAVQSIISTFTFAKVTLLFFMIAVVGLVGSSVHLEPTNDFAASMEPFLLGTVALGGVVNIMPVIFSRVPFNATGIWRFRAAVTGGVVLCWLTNLLWAFFVLEIVPQTDAQAIEDQVGHSQLRGIEVSLEKARRQGEISTVPVTQIIDHGFPQYSWVSTTVTVFIVLSVSVSFITMGTGLKHVLDGIVAQWSRDALGASESTAVVQSKQDHAARSYGTSPQSTHSASPAVGESHEAMHGSETPAVIGPWKDLSDPQGISSDGTAHHNTAAAASLAPGGTSGLAALPPGAGQDGTGSDASDVDIAEWEDTKGGTACAQGMWQGCLQCGRGITSACPFLLHPTGQRWAQYTFWFGLVLLIAMLNPQGFLVVLEVFTSLALNLESGLFVGLMYYRAATGNTVPFLVACGCRACYRPPKEPSPQPRLPAKRGRRGSTAGEVARALESDWSRITAHIAGGGAGAAGAGVGGLASDSATSSSALMLPDVPDDAERQPAQEVPEAPPLTIPLPLNPVFGSWLMWFTVTTFLGAVIFDIWITLAGLISPQRTAWIFAGAALAIWQVMGLPRLAGPPAFTVYHSMRPEPSQADGGCATPRMRDVVLPATAGACLCISALLVTPGIGAGAVQPAEAGAMAAAAAALAAWVAGGWLRFSSRAWTAALAADVMGIVATLVVAGLGVALEKPAVATVGGLAGLLAVLAAGLHSKTLRANAAMVQRWHSPEGGAVWALRGQALARIVHSLSADGKWGARAAPSTDTPQGGGWDTEALVTPTPSKEEEKEGADEDDS